MTDDQKGDPIYVSHLLLDTMAQGAQGPGPQAGRQRERGGDDDLRSAPRLGRPPVQGDSEGQGHGRDSRGNRFELILPNARFTRDPLLPEGAPPIQSAKERADCDDGDAGGEHRAERPS